MDVYGKVNTGKLKLKGEKKKKHKKHKKRDRSEDRDDDKKRSKREEIADCQKHGGWWVAENAHQAVGPVALQFSTGTYMKAMDNGRFTLGAPHDEGDPPAPEEILMAMKVGTDKISLKSGYDKYLRLDKAGHVVGVSDAVGAMETFETVWEEGKMAILGANGRFMSVDEEDSIVCEAPKVGDTEIVRIRSNKEREDLNKKVVPEEERGNVGQIELNYVKKFQKFQDHKIRMNTEHRGTLLIAKDQGNLHETLLDRREKMKSDRMCK